jgi:uncharacterized protein (TIGR02145 family)
MKNLIFIAFLICNIHLSFSQNTIKVGNYNWATENLSTLKFNNGELIPVAKNPEEWKVFQNSKKAACYVSLNKDGSKKVLYNIYAVFDKRGIIPAGWELPSDSQFQNLNEELSKTENKNLVSKLNFNFSGSIAEDGYFESSLIFWSIYDDRDLKLVGADGMQSAWNLDCGYTQDGNPRNPPLFEDGTFCQLTWFMCQMNVGRALRLVKK